MNLQAYERHEELLQRRAKVLQAEEQRLSGEAALSVTEARDALRNRMDGKQG